MHPVRRQRLIVVLFIVIGTAIAVTLVTYALRQNINLFYSPGDIAAGKAPIGKQIRAGGMVKKGSLKRSPDSLRVQFEVTDYVSHLEVVYTGILPDLFAEGQGVVATGKLDANGVFQASEVLAKHDEKYMPPEVQAAVDAAAKTVEN